MNNIPINTESNTNLIPSMDNTNFDFQQLMNITGQTALNINNMSKQLGIITMSVNTLTDDMNSVKSDIEQLKLNEEVTTTQQETIIETAQKRVSEILGNDSYEREKYFKMFIRRCYTDTKHYAGLGSKIARTRKGDFQRVIDYIEAWVPSCGCAELRRKADEKAEARRRAREEGYLAENHKKSILKKRK